MSVLRPFPANFLPALITSFTKLKVQAVILRCLSNWSKSSLVQKLWPKRKNAKNKSSANSPKFETDKRPFYNHFWPFFANHVIIFHKTEIQKVILRCLMSLKLNWCKSYATKCKNTENTNKSFFTKSQKTGNGNICILCHNLRTNQILGLLSTSKWQSEPQFCER